MRCNKCGEEYKENQAFCLKCGNPIHVVPDFNLIEAELANDVGALMDSEDEENSVSNSFDSGSTMKTLNVPVEDISMGLKMVDVNRGRFNFEEDDFTLIEDEEEMEPRRTPVNRQTRPQHPQSQPQRRTSANRNNPKAKQKNSKQSVVKNVLIMVGCLVAVALVVVLLWKVVFSNSLNDSVNFKQQYDVAKSYYDNNKKSEAIDEAKKTVQIARTQTEELKARKLLHDIYDHFEVLDAEYEENLLRIVELEPSNTKFSEALLDYYYNTKNFTEFNKLFAKLDGMGTTDNMMKYLPAKPTVNLEGGHYDIFLNIELSAAEGTTIYYTLDGKNPKNNDSAFTYVEPIKLTSEGETKLLAYAMDANGIMSPLLEVEYTIKDVQISGPVVTPSSGAHSEYQMITVIVPEGSTVYYTTDGSDPTSASTQYTEPIEMPYGRSDYKFVSIDATGVASNITSVTYNLSLDRNVTIAQAETLVMDKYIEENELDENAKDVNGYKYVFKYKEIIVANNAEYYVIEVSVDDSEVEADGEQPQEKEPEFFAVNSNNSVVLAITLSAEGYTVPEEPEKSEETEETEE